MIQNKDVRNKLITIATVAALPIVYVLAYWVIGEGRGPYYWTPNQDPDYAYLENALVLALLKVPQHTDHPGTTLQLLGAIVLRVSYWLQSWFNPALKPTLADEVLTHPELYLDLINAALLGITACALGLLGWAMLRLSNSLVLTLVLQFTPLLMIQTLLGEEASRVAPDILTFTVTQLLVIVLIAYLYQNQVERSPGFSIRLGAVFGLGMATKVTFLPMVVYFLLPRGWWRKGWAIGAAILAFGAATLPIFSRYRRTWEWLTGIATHTGPYGSGEVGLVNQTNLWRNATLLFSHNLVFFSLLLIATAACILFPIFWKFYRTRQDQLSEANTSTSTSLEGSRSSEGSLPQPKVSKIYFLLVLTTVAMWGQVILTIKEQPQSRYLDPSVGLVGLLVVLLIHLCLIVIPETLGRRVNGTRVMRVIPLLALALCVAISLQQGDRSLDRITRGSKRRSNELNKIETILQRQEYQSCTRVLSRRASNPEAALNYGNFWAGKQLAATLGQLYPDTVLYIDEDKVYETHTQPISVAELAARGNGCVLLQANSMPPQNWKAKFRPKEPIEKIFEGRLEALYRIQIN